MKCSHKIEDGSGEKRLELNYVSFDAFKCFRYFVCHLCLFVFNYVFGSDLDQKKCIEIDGRWRLQNTTLLDVKQVKWVMWSQ